MKEKKLLNIQIGERIHIARELSDMTQEMLSECVDVSVQYISDLERGIVGTSIPTLIKICETLHVSSDFILFNRTKETDVSYITEKIEHLPPEKLQIVEKGIHVLLEALSR